MIKYSLWCFAWIVFGFFVLTASPQAQQRHANIRAKATAHSTVLQWSDPSAAPTIGYFIYAGATPGGESSTHINPQMVSVGVLCTTAALYCTYTDSAVVQGTQKCYTVSASDGTRVSSMSTEVCATTPADPLAAPVLAPPIVN